MRSTLIRLPVLVLLTLPAPSFASDGVLEINQTCAVQTGCFAGDTAGYPVTITVTGSYRLTSNLPRSTLLGGSLNEHTIAISADGVTLDLGGFHISCAVILGGGRTCSGTGSGVNDSISTSGTSVKNGTISGMGADGLSLEAQSEVQNIRARRNGNRGISVNFGSTATGNTVYENGGIGIDGGAGSTISGNTSYFNVGDGIFADPGSTVSSNTAYANQGTGINARSGSNVQGNTVRGNGGYGLDIDATTGYRENVITLNQTGTVNGGVNMGANSCGGTTGCP